MSLYKFDTTTTPITWYEWDDGQWQAEDLSRNESLVANGDGTITLTKTKADLIKTVVFSPTPDATDDPTCFIETSETWRLPDGTVVSGPGEDPDDGIEDDQDGDGSDDDNLDGSDDDDLEHGGSGDDVIDGADGDDNENGGTGEDDFAAGTDAGNDKLTGGSGSDTVSYAGAGAGVSVDLAKGSARAASADAGIGVDKLSAIENADGSDFDDLLNGSAQANVLDGGDGDDVLTGGMGTDALTGGLGDDVFRFLTVRDSGLGARHDVVVDFASGDRIDLSAIDAKAGFTKNDAFVLLGGEAPTLANANGALWFRAGVLYGSTDADVAPEFEIALNGISSLTEADLGL